MFPYIDDVKYVLYIDHYLVHLLKAMNKHFFEKDL